MTLLQPDGSYASMETVRTLSIALGHNGFYFIKGFGLNEARFETLQAIHDTFCAFMAPIQLDYGGNALIQECLADLGYLAR